MRHSAWYQRMGLRWELRRLQTYPTPVPGFTGRVDRDLVFPERADGRPGFRLRAAGDPVLVGTRHECDNTGPCGATVEFHLALGSRSRMRCHSSLRQDGPFASRLAEHLAGAPRSALLEWRYLVEPVASRVAGEAAMTWTVEVVSGIGVGARLTDVVFDHGDRTFVVNVMETPGEQPGARDVAQQILDSWAWDRPAA